MKLNHSSDTPVKEKDDSVLKCLLTVAQHHGKVMSLVEIRNKSNVKNGSFTLKDAAETAETIGLRAHCVSVNFATLSKDITLPCIIKWNHEGFMVVKKIVQNQILIGIDKDSLTVSKTEFFKNWLYEDADEGMLLVLEPSPQFYKNDDTDAATQPQGLRSLLPYLKKYPKLVWQLAIGMIVGTLLKLTLPFLTQSIVDVGVMNNNLNFIYLFLAGQLMLTLGRNSLEAIRGWLQLYVSSRVGIMILTDFVAKVMRLNVSYFNEKAVGQVMQRVEDQKRIETFLATQLPAILFSSLSLVVYTVIFALYDLSIFAIFFGATLSYIGWLTIFMKKRRQCDFDRSLVAEQEQNKLVQIVQGMPDIKLANAEIVKRWDWEKVRAKLFLQNIKLLKISHGQQIGGSIINDLKTLLITFLSAKGVLDGSLSLGAMLAIQQMLGQTNVATDQLFAYFQQLQDARLSTERINKVHQLPEEEPLNSTSYIPENQPIILRNVHFQYPSANTATLHDIQLFIPAGKTTAIVGSSGSGKTTLLKLLMKQYAPNSGQLMLGKTNFGHISTRAWRSKCGAVMSDGVVFTDTILNNIALGDDDPDLTRVRRAAKIANIHRWVETQSLGYHTPIGGEHGSISHGQKQRLLIARAVYKDPEFFFFDEGTSALDVQNQQIIMRNLKELFGERTVVVVAHRLSTIRNADQIVVIEEGQIIEKGTHDELLSLEGRYYELLTTQLEAAA
jgi:ATP-binding cassette, subfamily B, bacterial